MHKKPFCVEVLKQSDCLGQVDPAEVCVTLCCVCVYEYKCIRVCVCGSEGVSMSFCAPFECRDIDGGDVGD